MKRDKILEIIRELAKSQGFYGRLLRDIEYAENTNPTVYEAFMTGLESKNFKEPLDLILYLES